MGDIDKIQVNALIDRYVMQVEQPALQWGTRFLRIPRAIIKRLVSRETLSLISPGPSMFRVGPVTSNLLYLPTEKWGEKCLLDADWHRNLPLLQGGRSPPVGKRI